ncbi:hypothetical protein C0992_011742 [Termitomyces sp. T32_za158]|nr:hypothetical protein C0992_011742 [Termitomyces sp. T32_za158]
MKVIIIGAGIGGLSAYLSLKRYLANDKVAIKIYESHGPASITGVEGNLSLAPNGLNAIASLSPKAIKHIRKNMNTDPIEDYSGRFQRRSWNVRSKRSGFDLIVRRVVVYEALLLDVPADAIIWYSKLQSVEEDERGVEVVFANGSSDIADLVIGADGIWSVVRECISGELYVPLTKPIMFKEGGSPWVLYQARKLPPVYDGFTGVGGSISFSRLSPRVQESLKTAGVIMTSGSSGLLFGYSRVLMTPDDDPSIEWWSIYGTITPPNQSHSHPSAVRAHLLSQCALWKSPHDFSDMSPYKEIIKLGCTRESDFHFLPQEDALRKPFWSSPSCTGRILLLGDAAHVLPYKSRQGASSAIEDAVAIGIFLHKFHEVGGLDIKNTLKWVERGYKDVRMGRVQKILDLAKKDKERERQKHPWLWWKVQNFFSDNYGE